MNDTTSPWPERRRTQGALLGTGGALLLLVGLALARIVALSDTAVVGAATVASALLVYGFLGWAGTWIEDDTRGENVHIEGVEDDDVDDEEVVGDDDTEDAGIEDAENEDAEGDDGRDGGHTTD